MQYNAKAIFTILNRRNIGSIKPSEKKKEISKIHVQLKRLSDRHKIRRAKRGFYQAKPSPKIIQKLEDPETKLHGIKLEIPITENNTLKIQGITAQNNIFNFIKTNHYNLVTKKNGTSLRRWTKQILFLDRWITVTIHDGGLVEIFCNSGDNPISYPEFVRFGDYLSGYFQQIFVFKHREVMITQVAMARDFEELQLYGVKCVTFHKFKNDWARIYQRENGVVRYEHHLTMNITLEDAYNSLQLLTQVPERKPVLNGFKPDTLEDVA